MDFFSYSNMSTPAPAATPGKDLVGSVVGGVTSTVSHIGDG
jgi:hypothetical protein